MSKRKKRRRWVVVVVLALLAVHAICDAPPPPKVATFYLGEYPRSPAQVDGVFKAFKASGAGLIALQGVAQPRKLATAVGWRLGDAWRYINPRRGVERSLGVLYNDNSLRVSAPRLHASLRVRDGARGAFEVTATPRRGGPSLRVIVVDLERGDDEGSRRARARQIEALAQIIRGPDGAKGSGNDDDSDARRVVLLGSFASTTAADRAHLAALAKATALSWMSREVQCTAYRVQPDGTCRAVAVDHVIAGGSADEVTAGGPCAKVGCDPRERCPRFAEQVSSHCPLVLQLAE